MKKPLVSIITVVYNGEKTIEQTIKSVLNQTYQNIEYIIVDGQSSDNTLAILNRYKDSISHIISEKDKGIYDAMNKGITLATGDIVGLLNADDYYESDTVENIVMHYKPGLNIYYGALRNIDKNDETFITPATDNASKLVRGMVINHPTMFVNQEVYQKYGKFSLEYKIAADWDFTLRCYKNKINFVKIYNVLCNFRVGGASGLITKKYLKEMSTIRKSNKVVGRIDFYYAYDSIRFFIFGKYLYKLYLIKKKITNAN